MARWVLPTPGGSRTDGLFVLGDLAVHFADRRITLAGDPVRLTAIELRLLAELAANAGRVLTYERLLQ